MTPSPEFPDSSDLRLAQVDPAHPFKSAWKTFLIAAVVVTLAIGTFVYIVHRPPVSSAEVLSVNYYPVHSTVDGGGGGAGMQGGKESFDQLVILARVRVHNQTDIPLFLQDISVTVTMPDDSTESSVAAGARDFNRIFQAFPDLSSLRSAPFDRSATIPPGQSTEGLAIFSFPFTRQQWDSRKKADMIISFIHQNDLRISFPR
ncbi:MAG TPA: hypothetical protein VGR96_19890 [Acidobacteriaceae bacterium]|nr:hypothetical protein [Acidobacteriaceae bacterium]